LTHIIEYYYVLTGEKVLFYTEISFLEDLLFIEFGSWFQIELALYLPLHLP